MSYNAVGSSSMSAGTSAAPSPANNPPSDRLYVGNLSPTVDEYTLIQIFQKVSPIKKLDFLFHKTGPSKGKPRGFAFVEFSTKEDATKAMTKLNGRMLRGRSLVMSYASQSQFEPSQQSLRGFRRKDDPVRTTTLSLIKGQRKPQSANAQIAALEAKLNSMQHSPLASASASTSNGPSSSNNQSPGTGMASGFNPASPGPVREGEGYEMEGIEGGSGTGAEEGGVGGREMGREAELLLDGVMEEIEGIRNGHSVEGTFTSDLDTATPTQTSIAATKSAKGKSKAITASSKDDEFDMDTFLGKNLPTNNPSTSKRTTTTSTFSKLVSGAGLPMKPDDMTLETARVVQKTDPKEEERRRR